MIEFIKFFIQGLRDWWRWTKTELMLTLAQLRAEQIAWQYQSHTETILKAYLHARRQGLSKTEAWWYVEQWLQYRP